MPDLQKVDSNKSVVALVVTQPFASYQKGDRITDADEVAKVKESNPNHVVAVANQE